MNSAENRLPALDGLRGIAILLVMLFHYGQQVRPVDTIDHLVLGASRVGWIGVDLFFVLSGFLITGILCDTRGAPNYFHSFYARRFLRIVPLYYATLVVLFVLLPLTVHEFLGATATRWPWFVLYASNFLVILRGFPSRYVQHLWSLAIEEQFYLTWPLMVFLLRPRPLLILGSAIIVGAATLRAAFDWHGGGDITNYAHTLTRADAFAIGAMVAIAFRDPIGHALLKRYAPVVLAVALPATVILVVKDPIRPAWLLWSFGEQVFGYSIIGLAAAAIIARSVTGPPRLRLNRFLRAPTLRFFGKYSYGIYMIHVPIDTAARAMDLHVSAIAGHVGNLTVSLLLYTLLSGAAAVGLALVSWNLIEQPFLSLKRRFVARRVDSDHVATESG